MKIKYYFKIIFKKVSNFFSFIFAIIKKFEKKGNHIKMKSTHYGSFNYIIRLNEKNNCNTKIL
tara:strand:+ start:187 stop:375 length:189 start_codon:yes stop_codon:yes gene_type:complete